MSWVAWRRYPEAFTRWQREKYYIRRPEGGLWTPRVALAWRFDTKDEAQLAIYHLAPPRRGQETGVEKVKDT